MDVYEIPLLADYLDRFGLPEPDPLCPELIVWNTLDFNGLWKRALSLNADAPVPYWGIVWPGGRALARFILDNAGLFRKRRVMDMGTGNGITAAAAAMCGASVTGFDIDSAALALAGMTAAKNNVKCEFRRAGADDITDEELVAYDIIIAGDIFNSADFAAAMLSLARRGLRTGMRNIFSDAGRSYRPKDTMNILKKMSVPVFREIEGITERDVKIFSLTE